MSLTREEAIIINNNKCNEGIISYIEGVGPLYERNITFLTKKGKTQNTETFIMTNRMNILDAYLLEKKRELEEIRRKENAISWAKLIEQERVNSIKKRLKQKQARIIQRRLEQEQEQKQNKYNDDLIFKMDDTNQYSNTYSKHYNTAFKLFSQILN